MSVSIDSAGLRQTMARGVLTLIVALRIDPAGCRQTMAHGVES